MSIPTEKDIKAARKSFRIIRREMKTLKSLLDTLSGKVEDDADEAVEAQPNGSGAHVEAGMPVQNEPSPHRDPSNPNRAVSGA